MKEETKNKISETLKRYYKDNANTEFERARRNKISDSMKEYYRNNSESQNEIERRKKLSKIMTIKNALFENYLNHLTIEDFNNIK